MGLRVKLYYMITGFEICACMIAAMAHAMYIMFACFVIAVCTWMFAESYNKIEGSKDE